MCAKDFRDTFNVLQSFYVNWYRSASADSGLSWPTKELVDEVTVLCA